jgi:hypothetical protein
VTLELDNDGVMRPADIEGVTRPVETDGVILPDIEGVVRPLRDEATEDGRDIIPIRTAGGDSFPEATKTPQLGGQEKYCILSE